MIASEGWRPLLAAAVAATGVHYWLGALWAAPLWVLCAAIVLVFHEPRRRVPPSPLAVLSPVDGRVVLSAESHDQWLNRVARLIRVRCRAPGIVVLRSPTEGKVMEFWARESSAPLDSGWWSRINRVASYAIWVQTDEGDDVVWAVSASRRFSRFKSDVAPGERVGQGQRTGFVYFANYIDVFTPARSRQVITCEQRTRAGDSVLANLVRG